jgi:SAM-dependent methyltransferase
MKPSQTYFIQELAKSPGAAVLDFACSTGALWDYVPAGTRMHGCDLRLDHRLAPRIKGREDCFRISTDPARIPFDDRMFDIVFANSAFEHVQPLREIVAECARVLKPGGRLIAVFPCKTVIVEPHVHLPFASWLPAGRLRHAYCTFMRGPDKKGDAYLRENTHHRRYGTYMRILREHFDCRDIAPELVRIAGGIPLPSWFVSRFYATAVDAVKHEGNTPASWNLRAP